ncbi:lanthionine synthetase-like protein [Aquimarina sp. MAR_2010_214]|uniref:lanthionine synthetase LanC family protein n=1 Tax=Aquimarina sp. MAR_2010_214 TaxID=1250026 RepID=UPI000C7142EB|nr:lanthionine synthetase LanC family protein [Aquimarina sp. MAR_2010_214]PKV52595.1 lanthionine synthetase-like protein [Aquimarina sp. MAR_2010_214]
MNEIEKCIHDEVLWIAEELIKASKEDENGLFWETLHKEPYGDFYNQVNEEIYNGVSGISLFFISLYKYTNNEEYLQIAKKSIAWTVSHIETLPIKYYTFYTGTIGVIYTLIKLYEVSGNPSDLETANALFLSLKNGIIDKVELDDLLSGNAGNLFVITLLYTYTQDPEQESVIRVLVERLIRNARISKYGLKWGYVSGTIDSLIGMSHGTCGIAHVLLEVGEALDYSELKWVAEKAFAFEDEYYSVSLASWVDMRVSDNPEIKDLALEQGLSYYLENEKSMNAWAHGNSGIGLSRCNAYTILKKKRHKISAIRAVSNTISDIEKEKDIPNYTLSTGLGSWIELLLTTSRVLKEESFMKEAKNLAKKAIDYRESNSFYGSGWYSNKSDPALLVGTSGIGHLFLQLLNENIDSILLPKIKSKKQLPPESKITLASFKKSIYEKYLERTIWFLENNGICVDKVYESGYNGFNSRGFSRKILGLIKVLDEEKKRMAMDIFKLESIIIDMHINVNYNIYREHKRDFFREQLSKFESQDFSIFHEYKFQISRHVKIVNCEWQWAQSDKKACLENQYDNKGDYNVLLRLGRHHVYEFPISQSSAFLLDILKRPRTLYNVIELLKRKLETNNEEILQQKFIQQLKYFMEQNFVEAKKYAG